MKTKCSKASHQAYLDSIVASNANVKHNNICTIKKKAKNRKGKRTKSYIVRCPESKRNEGEKIVWQLIMGGEREQYLKHRRM